jgi:hypothetical protein
MSEWATVAASGDSFDAVGVKISQGSVSGLLPT